MFPNTRKKLETASPPAGVRTIRRHDALRGTKLAPREGQPPTLADLGLIRALEDTIGRNPDEALVMTSEIINRTKRRIV